VIVILIIYLIISVKESILFNDHILTRMNRAAQHACDRDAKDKNHAQNLDDRMQQLRNSSAGLGFYPGIENVDNT
jgi:tektin-3